jgi:hypothetical protein
MKAPRVAVFRFPNPRSERICERLGRLVGPGAAAFYRDACCLMDGVEPPLKSTTHLVGHLLREIESALRDVLQPLAGKASKKRDRHKGEVEEVLHALGIKHDEPVGQAWLKVAEEESEYSLHRHAHRSSLAPPRPMNEDFRALWSNMEAILDTVLDRFEGRFIETQKLLDALLVKESPSRQDLDLLREHIPNNLVTFSYLFDRLPSPNWVEPLHNAGFFDYPPSAVWDEEGKGVSFEAWPQSRYLARMASQIPNVVSDIALALAASGCDNPRVHYDLAEAALAMPTQLAAQWAIKETEWVERQDQLYLSTLTLKLGELISHLAKGQEKGLEAALALTKALLEVFPDPRTKKETEELGELHFPEPRARCGAWEYGQVLRKNTPDVVNAAGERAVTLLCDLLDRTIDLSRRGKDETQAADYSYVWRSALDHGQGTDNDLKSMLVSAVRDAAEDLARANPKAVPTLVQELEQRKWAVFRRLALHLLRLFPQAAPELIEDRLTKCADYDDPHFKHEYSLLLQERFSTLRQESQDKILDWIFRGPGRDRAEAWLRFIEKEPTDEGIRRFEDRWRWEKLAPTKDVLPNEWKQRYAELEKQFGEPTDKEYVNFKTHFWSGPTSPKSAEDLRSLTIAEVVDYLNQWKWSGRFEGPSPDGLSRALTAAVVADPERFATEAERFIGVQEPTYLRGLIDGFVQAAKKGSAFPWEPVLKLCRWVVEQPREIPGRRENVYEIDPHWGWTRSEIARLLSAGLEERGNAIPYLLQDLAWRVLEPLTNDPFPSAEDEAKDGGSSMDPATLSINSTRGEAMHGVIRFGLWIRRHIEKEPDGKERAEKGFGEMPELRKVLESHLDPAKDPSPAIRSVYGQWFPWLVYLDSHWAKESVRRIFPRDEGSRGLRETAWESYITFCDPYDQIFELLKEEYSDAVDRIGAGKTEKRFLAHPEERLAQHLMLYYGRGKLSLEETEGLLQYFFTKADDKLRALAAEFVGRSLRDERDLPPKILDRFKALWEWRAKAVGSAADPASHRSELSAFGWWFVSAKLDDIWAMNELLNVLRLVQKAEPDHMVVERLASLVEKMPGECVECLRHLIEGDREGWGVLGWRDHARTVLATVLRTGSQDIKQAGVDIVNRLSARHHFEFRDLLSPE